MVESKFRDTCDTCFLSNVYYQTVCFFGLVPYFVVREKAESARKKIEPARKKDLTCQKKRLNLHGKDINLGWKKLGPLGNSFLIRLLIFPGIYLLLRPSVS